MEKKLLVGAVSFIIGGIVAKSIKEGIRLRKERLEEVGKNNELQN